MNERLRKALLAENAARAALNDADEPTDDLRAALTSASAEVRDALEDASEPANTEPASNAPDARVAELRESVRPGRYLAAAIQGQPVAGAEAEYAAEMGCPGAVPLDMFAEPETRADAVTTGPDANTQRNTAAILPAIFQGSVAAMLGIEMPTVAAGQAVYPIITKSATAAPASPATARDATAATIGVTALGPSRITGSVVYRKEDAALLGDLDSALTGNIRAVLTDAFDNQIINGNATAPNMRGLQTQLPLPAAGTDAAATTYAVLVQRAAGMIDGLFAETFGELRAAMSVQAYAYLASLFRANENDDTGLDFLMRMFGTVRANGRIAQAAQTAADGARSSVFVRRSRAVGRVAVAPVWQGVNLIRDEITGASAGTVKVTADMLVGGIGFLRSDAFATFSIATGDKK